MVQLFVTSIDTIGPHLRIFGQLDRKHMEVVQSNIDSLLTHGKLGEQSVLKVGILCLARRFDKFSRAKIQSVEGMDYVTVHYIDYGDDQTIHVQELRLIKLPKMLEKFPQQVSSYILSGIYCDWKPYHIQEITNDICNVMVEMQVEMEIFDIAFVRIFFGRQDLSEYLIKNRGIGLPIGLDKLRETFCHIMDSSLKVKSPTLYNNNSIKENSRGIVPVRGLRTETSSLQNVGYYPVQPMMAAPAIVQARAVAPRKDLHVANLQTFNPTVLGMQNRNYRMPYQGPEKIMGQSKESEIDTSLKRSVATFKSNTLMVGMFYDVYCCFVENGPCSFSVQLKSCEDDLNEMMSELENTPLKNLNDRPSLGMACIARFSEDGQLYRAVIMSIKPTECQVAYVDYGNTEMVPFHDLYEIPTNFLDQKTFAVRFALSGYKELEPIDDFIKNTFKELVLHRNLKLKVMPLEGPPLVQYCELYEGQANILEALKAHKNRKLRYSEPEALHANDVVVVCYVESPKKFFVQKVSNIQSFEQMMDDLFLFCKKTRNSLNNLAKGTACAVKFENAWYRAEIIGLNGNRVSIRHVDFGNERKVDPNQLCSLTERLVQFPPQAIQCCLKGFENTETLSESATVQLEMLAESDEGDRRHFKCQIFKIEQNGAALVNLIDESMRPELNLMKKLYKLSMPFNKYIGLEKEEGGFETNSAPKSFQPHKESHATLLNSTYLNDTESVQQQSSSDWDSGNVHHQPTSDWEAGSSGSTDTRNSSGDNRSRQNQHQGSRSFRENNRDNNRREQSHTTFKGKNLPPRFQKQQNDNRRYRDNKMNNSFERDNKMNSFERDNKMNNSFDRDKKMNNSFERNRNTSSETSGKFSQNPRNSCSQVESEQDWSSEFDVGISKEEYVSPETSFPKTSIDTPSREEAIICWWISPHQFYTHLRSRTAEFENMMREMQTFYKNKSATNTLLSVGSSVIARYRDDNVLYRAKIIACNQSLRKYRVEFVDFGNQSTAGENDIYQVEKRFADKPVMAYLCSFEDVISNFDHNYITSRVEQYIKPGTTVICEYTRKENDLYYVNVEINGNSLKELMINDGLMSALDTDMKLDMLSGQQVKAKITSIQDLLNFKIEIEGCNLELLCSYNDIKFVKSNPHLSSEFKNNYEGMSCIVDVLDVTGEKILMLQPHIPLITNEFPLAICNYPIIHQSLTIKVVYVQSTNKIYVHPVTVEDTLAQLLDDMYTFYDASGNALTDIQPGILCATNSNDGNWYRARIVSLTNDDKVEVYFIDYGNTELIDSIDKLKVLEETFYNSSALAVGVYLPLKSINEKEEAVIDEIRSLTEGYELTLQILECYKSCWVADISSNGYSLINVLEDKSLIQGRDIEYAKNLIDNGVSFTDVHPVIFKSKAVEYTTLNNEQTSQSEQPAPTGTAVMTTQEENTKNMIPAYLSHCDNPGRFFLHSVEDFDELTKLQDNIQIVAGSLPPLMSIITGAPCIALYSVDDTWYRAKIIDNEIMAVQFIDYGNTDVITDSSYIKEMNEAFGNIKPFAIPCSLSVAPKGTVDWIDEANAIFNESYEKTLYFEYITKGDKKNFINLVIDGEDVAEKLVMDGFARKLEILKSGVNCFVSHINNLSDFYIQMESDADALELIAGHLAGYEDFPIMENCEEGSICAALFTDDGEWYRAKILSKTTEGVEVLFIDYGNAAIAGEIRQISEDIALLPFLSKKCSLRMPDNILGWSDLAEEKFSELSAMGQTVFVVQLVEPGDHAIIDLYVDDRNILEDLEPLCDKRPNITMDSSFISEKEILRSINEPDLRNASISHINSPADFYVQFTSNTDQLNYITDSLNGDRTFEKLTQPEENCICAAVFPDDEALYRAKVLSITENGCSVLFIDFGNIASSTELFKLPDELKNIEPLAIRCTLENPSSNIDLSSDRAYETFNSLLTPFYSETVQIEVVNHVVNPWIVHMICKNCNIYKELLKTLEDTEFNKEEILTNENDIIRGKNNGDENGDAGQLTDAVVDLPQEPLNEEAIGADKFEETEHTNLAEQRTQEFITEENFADNINSAEKSIVEDSMLGNQTPSENATLLPECIIPAEDILDLEENNRPEEHLIEQIETSIPAQEVEPLPEKSMGLAKQSISPIHLNEMTSEKPLESVFVSHIVSPSEFYIQSQSQSHPLKKITDLLEAAEVYEKLTSPEVGSLCVAISADDGAYYRAKILSLDGDSSEVFLIDYGNKTNTGDLRVLPEELQIFESIAQKCSLYKVAGIDYDEPKVIKAFNSLMEAHFGESFQIEEVGSSEKQLKTVKLFIQDIEIGAEVFKIIREECKKPEMVKDLKKVFVSHTNSPNDFYIQFSDDISILDEITESLGNAIDFETLSNPSTNAICAAKFPNDGAFYRAKILSVGDSESEVLFIDFGNTAYSDDLRILPDDLKKIKCVAHHCALENLSDIDFWTQSATDLFSSLIGSHLNETFHAQIIEESTDSLIVILYYHNTNVGEELVKTLKELTVENVTEIWDTVENTTEDFTNEIVDSLVGNAEIIDNIIENVRVYTNMEQTNVIEGTAKHFDDNVDTGLKNTEEDFASEIVATLVENAEIIDDIIEEVGINSNMEQDNLSKIATKESDDNVDTEVKNTTEDLTSEIIDTLVENAEIIDNIVENVPISTNMEPTSVTQLTAKEYDNNVDTEVKNTTEDFASEIIDTLVENAEVIDNIVENVPISAKIEPTSVTQITAKESDDNVDMEVKNSTTEDFTSEIVDTLVANAEIIDNIVQNVPISTNMEPTSVTQLSAKECDNNADTEAKNSTEDFTSEIVDTLVENAEIIDIIVENVPISANIEPTSVTRLTAKECDNNADMEVKNTTEDFTSEIVDTLVENAEANDNVIENDPIKSGMVQFIVSQTMVKDSGNDVVAEGKNTMEDFSNEIVDTLVENTEIDNVHKINSMAQFHVSQITKESADDVDTDVNDTTENFTNEIVDNLVENAQIIDTLIENVRISSSMEEIDVSQITTQESGDNVNTDSSNINRSISSSNVCILNKEHQVYSAAELGEKLWNRYRDLAMPLSDFNKNRAVSTSNIPQSNSLLSSSSSLLNIRDTNTRSKSSDCLHVAAEK